MATNDTIALVTLCYWYPPVEMTPNSISAINIDSNYLIDIKFGSNDIKVTPTAFLNWYVINQNSIISSSNAAVLSEWYTKLTSQNIDINPLAQPFGIYANANDQTAAYIASQGWLWDTYAQYQAMSIYKTPNGVYATDPTGLYALINPVQTSADWQLLIIELIVLGAGMMVIWALFKKMLGSSTSKVPKKEKGPGLLGKTSMVIGSAATARSEKKAAAKAEKAADIKAGYDYQLAKARKYNTEYERPEQEARAKEKRTAEAKEEGRLKAISDEARREYRHPSKDRVSLKKE